MRDETGQGQGGCARRRPPASCGIGGNGGYTGLRHPVIAISGTSPFRASFRRKSRPDITRMPMHDEDADRPLLAAVALGPGRSSSGTAPCCARSPTRSRRKADAGEKLLGHKTVSRERLFYARSVLREAADLVPQRGMHSQFRGETGKSVKLRHVHPRSTLGSGGDMRRRDLVAIFGAMVIWPFAAEAQQKATPVIGFLSSASPSSFGPFVAAFQHGLSEAGYVEGQNIAIEYRWAEGHYDRLPELAADLVGRKVDVIIASGGAPPTRAARNATQSIPIVFTAVSDPVAQGLVTSLARPGGNLTGFSIMGTELVPKRLEFLFELVPRTSVIGLLLNPNIEIPQSVVKDAEEAANRRRVKLHVLHATTEKEIDVALATLDQLHAGALLVGDDPSFTNQREQLVALASRYAVPAIYQWRDFAVAGGLISYGVSLRTLYSLADARAARILKGALPTDLPIEQPAVFELVINLKTAETLDLTIPASLLGRADEIIE